MTLPTRRPKPWHPPAALLVRLASILALLALWHVAATLAASRTLPPTAAVFEVMLRETRTGELPAHIGATLARVAVSFTLAMAIGTVIGVALGRVRALDRAFDTWLLAVLNTPALVVTVLAYVWLGLTEAAAILAVTVNKIPNVAVIMREGARSLDPGLEEMRRAYRFDRATWIRHVLLPQLAPYWVAAARSGLALVWKIVLLVELLGRPDGVGYAISYHFQLFDVAGLLSYSIAFAAIVFAIDVLVLQPLETHARRWRPAA
ncbi:ABC transporter permease [Salinarimonas soli]|uniref:ABC transporter permease subunit n=1 Tax=Salinarimonas soli TaxID=1638099 RepID=A0A5B2VHD6_9HYPH|nr:ABC transporter permease subunit [Salinarimonas soli]KAA2237597.1 ABC transporter permease subunit [Salinarimonas soli]